MTDQTFPAIPDEEVITEGISFDDYMIQFAGQKTEWHAGKVVQKVSNNTKHQMILGFLYSLFCKVSKISGIGFVPFFGKKGTPKNFNQGCILMIMG